LATLRAYPRAQMLRSAKNFKDQLRAIGLYDLGASAYVLSEFDKTFRAGRERYLQGRQARNVMPLGFFSRLQARAVFASLVVMGAFTVLLWRRQPIRLIGLGAVIISMVLANAFVTGAMSTVEDRYESRVIWLLPLMAGLLAMEWLENRVKTVTLRGKTQGPES